MVVLSIFCSILILVLDPSTVGGYALNDQGLK